MNEPSRQYAEPETGQTPESLARLVTLLRRGARPALIFGLLAAAAVFAWRSLAGETYSATATLLLASPQQGLDSLGIVTPPAVDAGAYRTLILDGPLVEQTMQQRGEVVTIETARAVRDNLRVSIDSQQISSVLRITYSDPNALRAADTVNRLASATVDWDRERGRQGLTSGIGSLERSVQQLMAQLAEQEAAGADTSVTAALLAQQQNELAGARARLAVIVVTPLIDVLRFAEPATQPEPKRAVFFAVVAFVVVALLIYLALFVRVLLNQRLRSSAEASAVTRLPVLSVFPGAGHRDLERAERDAADILRESIISTASEDDTIVVLVTTAESSSGRRTVSTALAESFGRGGYRTMLVDANLRNPSTGDAFGLRDGEFASLEQYLLQPDKRLELVAARRDGVRMFSLMPSFRPAEWPADLLRGAMPELIDNWRRHFEVIILETAPLLPYPDTLGIASLADHAVLVAGMGRSDPVRLQAAADSLRKFGARRPSMVLVDTPSLGWTLGMKRDPISLAQRYSISVLRSSRRSEDSTDG